MKTDEDGFFFKKSLRISYVLYFHKFKNEGGEKKNKKNTKLACYIFIFCLCRGNVGNKVYLGNVTV